MKIVAKNLAKFIEGAILLTLGILVIIVGAGNAEASKTVSTVIGVVLLVIGTLTLLLAILNGVKNKASFAALAVSSGALIGVGISLFVHPWAMEIVNLFLYVIPYILICVGAVVICDGVFTLVLRRKEKGALAAGLLAIVSGAVALTFGILCVGDKPVISGGTQLIVFGIIIVVLATVALLTTVINASKE